MLAFTPNVPPCTADMLTLSTDAGDGDRNGMSHAGTWLVLTNKSGQACTVEANVAWQLVRGTTVVQSGHTTAKQGCPVRTTWTVSVPGLASIPGLSLATNIGEPASFVV